MMDESSKYIKELIEYSKNGILSKEIVKSKKMNATLFCMAKNTEMSEHTSTKEGIVYVLEGNGIFNLNGKDISMLPGTFIHMKKNSPHSLTAHENTSFLLLLCNN